MTIYRLTHPLAMSGALALSLFGGFAHANTLFAVDNTTVGVSGVVIINPKTMATVSTVELLNPVTGLAANSESNFFTSEGSTITNYGVGGNYINVHTAGSADHFYDLSIAHNRLFAVDNTSVGIYGVVILDPATLKVTGTIQIDQGFISGLAAGNSNDVYVSVAHKVFHYGTAGNLLGSHTFLNTDNMDNLFLRGSTLYAVSNPLLGSKKIMALDATTLAVTGSFSVIGAVRGLTGDSSGLFGSVSSTIYKFDTLGNVLNSHQGANADKFYDLAYVPTAFQPPFPTMELGASMGNYWSLAPQMGSPEDIGERPLSLRS